MTLQNLASDVARKLNRHAPTILTVFSTAGVAATAYLFHRAGVKAERAVISEQFTNEIYEDYPMGVENRIQLTWHYYVIPLSVGIATVTCLISANVLNTQRQATLMGAYALAERTVAKYRDKVLEMVGADGEQVIREDIVRDVAAETPAAKVPLGAEGTLFLDIFSGQQFVSSEDDIVLAQQHVNELCETEGFASLNYFYDAIGARTTELGELVGWTDAFPMEVILSPITFEDGTKGYGLDYRRMPSMGYSELW
jgi:hypothetical protein